VTQVISRRTVSVCVALCALLVGGCSRSASNIKTERHEGPKVNLTDFFHNTTAYKGKTVTLTLMVDEAPAPNSSPNLKEFVGRYVKFRASGPKGEKLNLVIKIPQTLTVPDVGIAEEVRVTFVCEQGDLRQGNVARSVVKS
jgi:hypothetical protein